MELKVAIRNIFRNRRRSTINILSIVVGLVALVLIGGYYQYNFEGLRETLIRSQYAHVQLTKRGHLESQETNPFDNLIYEYDDIIKELSLDERVEVVTPRLTSWGLLVGDDSSQVVRVVGVVPERESLINLFITSKQGSELRSRDFDKVEIGKALAESINSEVGGKALISVVDSEGYHNAFNYTIKGITGSFSEDYDKILVKLNLKSMQDLVYVDGVQELVILLGETEDTESYIKELKEIIKKNNWDFEVNSWYDRAGYFRQVVQYYGGFFKIILTIIIIVIFFTTLNTMLMATLERVTEVGTLRSFGTPSSKIVKMFLLEGLFIGLISFVAAMALAFIIKLGIDLGGGFSVPPPPGLSVEYKAFIYITRSHIIVAGLLAIIVPLFSALIPSIKVVTMEVMQQIQYNDK